MPTRFHSFGRALALASALLSSACTKTHQNEPTPGTPTNLGTISGLVQPADAVPNVSLSNTIGGQSIATVAVNSQTGAYTFVSVPAGTYSVRFDKSSGYVPPRPQSVTVAGGNTTVVPTAVAMRTTAAFTVDGMTFNPPYIDLSLGFDGKSFPSSQCFSLVLGNGLGFSPPSPGTYALFLTMPYAVHVGTYALNDALTYAIFTDATAGTFDSRANPATVPSAGKLTITAVENTTPFPRSVSGTFSCTATNTATGAQKVISGSFANACF